MTTSGILPTEKDGEWVGEVLSGVMPDDLDSREWVQGAEQEFEGRLTNTFTQKGQNLVVLVTVAPVQIKDSDVKKVNYHVICYRRDGDKIKKPNEADISRVRGTFFGRELTPAERIHEGAIGESKAHHFVSLFEYKPIVIAGA